MAQILLRNIEPEKRGSDPFSGNQGRHKACPDGHCEADGDERGGPRPPLLAFRAGVFVAENCHELFAAVVEPLERARL
ncbi:MAG: hypothetical protein RIR86_1408, partial [Acidobacteriota bacterium]